MNKGNKLSPKEQLGIKKIKKMYQNYGINTSDMDEEELLRLYKDYTSSSKDKDLDADLKKSERYSNVFGEDEIIG